MSPEQFENTRNVDKRADIYSMGIMLYEMVTGKKTVSRELRARYYPDDSKGTICAREKA
jgi:serine/threonine-protein kinase